MDHFFADEPSGNVNSKDPDSHGSFAIFFRTFATYFQAKKYL